MFNPIRNIPMGKLAKLVSTKLMVRKKWGEIRGAKEREKEKHCTVLGIYLERDSLVTHTDIKIRALK